MNLVESEQILIKDIFDVSVGQSYIICNARTQAKCQLVEFPREISKLGNKITLLEHEAYFDSLLMERLQMPGTQILAYLEECLGKCYYIIGKPWNEHPNSNKFIKYSMEIIRSFIFLSLQEPQFFPYQVQIDYQATKIAQKSLNIAMRLMSHFQRRGFNMEILALVYHKIQEEITDSFPEVFMEVLLARQRFQTILQKNSFFYLCLLQQVISDSNFKNAFLNLQKMPFLPAKLSHIMGSMIDRQSPLGLFARLSILGFSPGFYHQEGSAHKKFEERMISQLGNEKLRRERLKFYADLQNEFNAKLTEIFKCFLKKDTQQQFLQWVYAVIVGNILKSKLASRLQASNNLNLSHDGLILNVYQCMLNICRVILNPNEDKHKSIDPEYFMYNNRILLCKYDKLNKKQPKPRMEMQKKFGTITQFFFLSVELINMGLIPALDNLIELYERKEKFQKQKAKFQESNPLKKKIQNEIQRMQSQLIRYYILLFDEPLIIGTIKIFDMILFKLSAWLGFEYENLSHGRIENYTMPDLAMYLPEHFLQSIYKFHFTNFKFKRNYLELIGESHVHEIVKVTCLLLSEEGIISNPYMGANFIQLLFYLLQQNKSGIMCQVFKSNLICQTNLTLGMIKFYCDIAVTGSSHQFYSKFKYRYYVNKIFTSLWVFEVYRNNLQIYFHKPVFQKFLNMVMTDTTYCFDETNDSYDSYKSLQSKKQQGQLSQEDLKNQEQLNSVISATLQQSTSNLKLMRQLSAWSPNTFLSAAEISTIVPLLNNILKTFIDPTSFIANHHLLTKHRFQKASTLSDLLQIYVNIDINDKLSNEIVRDARNYKKQYFSKSLQKASNEHYTSIATLESFEDLINKLSTAVNQEEDEEIYGEIPEKYLCQLMSTLMKDPVLLPGSGKLVDRVNIHRSLLIDERDPFTRAPLRQEEVEQQPNLRMEIENWKKNRLEELKKGDKEVKYGKIAARKKEDNSNNILGDKMLGYEDQDPQQQ